MVDLDLKALSAPLEALRHEVDAAYKYLDERWEEVTEQLKKLPIPCAVSYTWDSDDYDPEQFMTLDWRKWKGSKRVCIVSHTYDRYHDVAGEEVTPYDEWSAEQRAAMLKHVPGLFESAVKQTKAFVERICGQEVPK